MIRSLVLVFCVALSWPALADEGEGPLVNELPKGVSIPDVIKSFAAKEKEFKQAIEGYMYTRDVIVRASCQDRQPEVYESVFDVTFDAKGNRTEKVKAIRSALECIAITKEDLESVRDQSLFALTSDDIQDYQISFAGQQQEGDLHCYVFDVSPLAMQAGKQYFAGRIWVQDRDFQIVKTHGTIASKREKKGKGQENLFPAFSTWREEIEGRYWFPAYILASDVLHFSAAKVQIEEVVKFTNYKAK
jgi:hypothetical protein